MPRYEDAKKVILEEPISTKIEGVPLSGAAYRGKWSPIFPCLPNPGCICVTEPCPCDKLCVDETIVVWLPPDILGEEKTGKKYKEEEDIISYQLERDTEVLVEAHIPLTVGELRRMAQIMEKAERGEGKMSPIIQASKKTKGKSKLGALLVAAFELGWAIGEKVDEETGLSDKISDWLAENTPWPW